MPAIGYQQMGTVNTPIFKDKFVGYVDVLGFKTLVKAAESGNGMSLSRLLELLKLLGTSDNRHRYVKHGPHLCPRAPFLQHDLDFQVTQVSDCAVVAAEISPSGIINLVNHCWVAVLGLLTHGIMCRGYITRGLVYHTEAQVIGSGYHRAVSMEQGVSAFRRNADERGTPYVEIDEAVCKYVRECTDDCVREMYSRQVETDGSVTVLFPFKRISHKFMLSPRSKFDAVKEKRAVQNVRAMLAEVKGRIEEFINRLDPAAVSKAQHYIGALDRQLEVCDRTDDVIDRLTSSLGTA